MSLRPNLHLALTLPLSWARLYVVGAKQDLRQWRVSGAWIGAAYLIWLGISALRSDGSGLFRTALKHRHS